MLLDAHGCEFTPGASACVCEWSAEDTLSIPYLWKVEKLPSGTLGLQSRPAGESQELTPSLAQVLCLFEEPSFVQPEANADLWQRFLQLGWVIKAEKVPNKSEFLFRVKRAKPIAGQRNAHHVLITAISLRGAGDLDDQRARLIWKYLLKGIEKSHAR